MTDVIYAYFLILLAFQPIEELHNCNNPNLIGEVPHFICSWEENDFILTIDKHNNKRWLLKTKRNQDNFIKAHYRRKYWDAE